LGSIENDHHDIMIDYAQLNIMNHNGKHSGDDASAVVCIFIFVYNYIHAKVQVLFQAGYEHLFGRMPVAM